MFVKLIAIIKNASIATKIISATIAVAIVAGGATAAIIVINQPKISEPEAEYPHSASNHNIDTDKEEAKPEEKPAEVATAQTANQPAETQNPEKPSNPTNQPENIDPPAMPSNSEKPTNDEPSSEPEQPSDPVSPSEPSEPEPEKTCSDLQNCDFNLNEKFVIETDTFDFYKLPEGVNGVCDENEAGDFYLNVTPIEKTITFYQIGHFTGKGGNNVPHVTPDRTATTGVQADNYAKANGYVAFHQGWGCGGMGDIERDWTWQETIDKGFALDEEKCSTYGLSCGRW